MGGIERLKVRKAAKRVLQEDISFKLIADGHVDIDNKNIRTEITDIDQ